MPDFVTSPALMILCAVLGYLLGAVPFGLVITRALGLGDLRAIGSGNIGATNVLRTGHKGAALATLVLDAAKGAVAVLIARCLVGEDAAQLAGGMAFLGHLFPVWLGFKGGKGVATAIGVFGVLAPWPTAIAAAAFGLTVARTRFVSLGSIVAAVLLPVIQWSMPGVSAVDIGATIVAALILFRHRGNVARLWSRTERALGT